MSHKISHFYLQRNVDESGVSGTGIVAVGVILPSGVCILEWQTFHSSIAHYKNIADVEAIHGHEGKTKIVMGDVPSDKKKRKKKDKENA
ncbi:MAG TPA: hypothetical protein DDY18_03280 [Flavobacterium sp.]|jgi:hypothetical protein|nr:hypothetical protein [Flavobacterium sp.]